MFKKLNIIIILTLAIIFSVNVYAVSTSCYQEDVAIPNQAGNDGNCNLNYSGSYSGLSNANYHDGNFVTGSGSTQLTGYFIAKYYAPNNTLSAISYYSYANDFTNTPVYIGCLNSTGVQNLLLVDNFISDFKYNISVPSSCFINNSISMYYPNRKNGIGDSVIFNEEGMLWDIENLTTYPLILSTYELFTNNAINHNFIYTRSDNVKFPISSNNFTDTFILPTEIYNVTVSSPGYNNCTYNNINLSSPITLNDCVLYNSKLNVSVFNSANTPLSNIEMNITDLGSLTKNTYYFNSSADIFLVTNRSYSILFNVPGYAFNTTIINPTDILNNLSTNLLENNFIAISVVSELTSAIITQPIGLQLQSSTNLSNYTISNGFLNISNIVPAFYTLTFTSTNFSTRIYSINIFDRSFQTLTARLLNNNDSIIIGVYTKDSSYRVLPNTLITIQKQYNGGSYATVSQSLTDINGFATFYVEQNVNYKIILSADGFSTKEFYQTFYTANSPYTFLLSSNAGNPYVNVFDGVNYYYTPNSTNLQKGIYTFSITTYNSSFSIYYTAINVNGTIVNVSGSPTGGTAALTVDLTNFVGTYPVTYMFNYYDVNTNKPHLYIIPLGYYFSGDKPYNTTLPQTFTKLKTDIGSQGWIAILAVFIILAGVITVMQISQNTLAGIGIGFGLMIFFAFVGWISGILVAIIVISSGFMLYMERQ